MQGAKMTLAMAWVRIMPDGCEELIVASDSRLSGGGRRIDCVPKILALPRSDSFICFAGETDYAYPLMLQAMLAIEGYDRSRSRAMDIREMKGQVLNIFNAMIESVDNQVNRDEVPDVRFIFGGYSWVRKQFRIWLLEYDKNAGRMVSSRINNRMGNFTRFCFAGDKEWTKLARKRLGELLRARYNLRRGASDSQGFDLEPFEVLRDLLREKADDRWCSIGGPPQVIKVYQHMNARPIGVYWPNKDLGKITVSVRELTGIETTNFWILDPDELRTSNLFYSRPTDDEAVVEEIVV